MAQSALRDISPTWWKDIKPQPAQRPAGQQIADFLGGVSIPLSAVPVVGDIAGMGADAAMYAAYPEQRTMMNAGMSLAGLLPFVPNAAGVRTAEKAADAVDDLADLSTVPLVRDAASASLQKMTREEFLGDPKIVSRSDASRLRPIAVIGVADAPAEQFIGGLTLKKSPDGAAVFDGDKIVASYNFGRNLVVDPKYRKKGIAEELVYRWRTAYPAPAEAETRTKASQRIQENVWERIQREQRGGLEGSTPTPAVLTKKDGGLVKGYNKGGEA